MALTLCLMAVLTLAVIGSLPQANTTRLNPWAPHGVSGIATAVGMLFFSFAGWEAVAPLTRTFRDPGRDVRAITVMTLGITAVIYLSLSAITILVLGQQLQTSDTSITLLLEPVLGRHAAIVTGVLAAVLTFGTTTSYLTGAGHMAAGLARDGWLPQQFMTSTDEVTTPRFGIAVIAAAALTVLAIMAATHVTLSGVMTLASAMFIAVTVLGLASAWRLLADIPGRVVGLASAALMAGVLASCGLAALYPVTVLAIVVLAGQHLSPTKRGEGS